ncbi:MAG: class IV adenylate cyclase [Acidobacteria bacterium]|nr:class IV adenylate cyclase [Acidobacteriota bacterium]
MAASDSNHETEIKLRVRDAGTGRRLLKSAGFGVLRRRLFERNVLFDTPAGDLRSRRCLLRVRRAGRRAILTFKGAPEAGRHKSREEIELGLDEPEQFEAILERLGYQPVFRYEKFRTEYGRSGEPGVATLDETPIGFFFELEGPSGWIDRTAAELGFAEPDYILASYATLYVAYCQERGIQPTDMTFGTANPSIPP